MMHFYVNMKYTMNMKLHKRYTEVSEIKNNKITK